MLRNFLIFLFLISSSFSNAEVKDRIVQNLKDTENLDWHPNVSKAYWAINLERVTFNSDHFEMELPSNVSIVDSGSSFIMMPYDKFGEFFTKLSEIANCLITDNLQIFCLVSREDYPKLPEMHI